MEHGRVRACMAAEFEAGGLKAKGLVKNISEGGLFVGTGTIPELGENVDLRFNDFPGTWQHFSIPLSGLSEGTFEEGIPFDGSSIRGWKSIPITAFLPPSSMAWRL